MSKKYNEISNLDEIKDILLGILVYFDNLCAEHGIRYSLAYGTMIGAIRHQGFIPWDDDIDVYMPRDDYQRFVGICLENPDLRYKLVSMETNGSYDSVIPKIVDTRTYLMQETAGSQRDRKGKEKYQLGLYIDIFVLDALPMEKNQQRKIILYAILLQKFWGFSFFTPHNQKKNLINWIRLQINKTNLAHFFAHKLNCFATNAYEGRYFLLGNILYGGERGLYDCCAVDDFTKCVKVDFEGHQMKALRNYDEILKKWYGDYMIPPPIDKRVSNHSYKAYWENSDIS